MPGATVVGVAIDEQPVGLLVFQDALRPDAKAVVARLNELGTRTVLITGSRAFRICSTCRGRR